MTTDPKPKPPTDKPVAWMVTWEDAPDPIRNLDKGQGWHFDLDEQAAREFYNRKLGLEGDVLDGISLPVPLYPGSVVTALRERVEELEGELKHLADASDRQLHYNYCDENNDCFPDCCDCARRVMEQALVRARAALEGRTAGGEGVEKGDCPACDGHLSAVGYVNHAIILECDYCHLQATTDLARRDYLGERCKELRASRKAATERQDKR